VKRMLATAAIAAVPTTPALAHDGCHSDTCRERVARKQCSQRRPVKCVLRAAYTHRVSLITLKVIGYCESRLDPLAHNASGSSGLFQILPSTFATTPYANRWLFSAKWNSLAGAYLLRHQGTTPWNASKECWG
jgi:hypothetical protein